jgi:ribosome-associated protein
MPDSQLPTSSTLVTSTSINSDQDATLDLAITAARVADERKGGDILVLNVADVTALADYFVLVTGYSKVQVRAIARSIEDAVKESLNRLPIRSEGMSDGAWVLQDYGDVIIHVLLPQERDFYNLEAFWGHAQRVDVSPYLSENPVRHR